MTGEPAAEARRLLAVGRVAEGFQALAAATTGPGAAVSFRLAAPRWSIGRPEPGQIVVMGEEQLSDEILFASLVRTLPAANAPYILALDRRWLSLAARSFPAVRVVERLTRTFNGGLQHAARLDSVQVHAGQLVSAFTTLREVLPAQWAAPSDFDGSPYLTPDPGRVAYWRAWLEAIGPGLKVGVDHGTASASTSGGAPRPGDFEAAVRQERLRLIDLPAFPAEAAPASPDRSASIPTGLDPEDLEGLAALTAALDAVVGPPGVATYVAGGVGARTFILTPPGHWSMLGADGYPWFARARAFTATAQNDWVQALADLSDALARLAAEAGDEAQGRRPA